MSLLSTAARALPRSGIRVVMDEAWALEEELRSRTAGARNSRTFDRVIHLEVGQPDFESPAAAVSAASHTLAKGGSATKYCPNAGTSELRHAVADYYQNTLNTVCRVTCQTTEQNIVVSTGSMFALSTAFMCALEPGSGEECLIPDPGFPNYAMAIQMLGCRPVRYPMLSSDGWLPTADAIANRITAGRTKLLLLNSPSNPTGRVMPLELMQSIVDVARENDVAVLSDEVGKVPLKPCDWRFHPADPLFHLLCLSIDLWGHIFRCQLQQQQQQCVAGGGTCTEHFALRS